MNLELQQLLWLVGIGGGIGLIIGLIVRWRFTSAANQYGQWSQNLAWYWYGVFGLMFIDFALLSWTQIYFALFFLAFALVEFAVMGLQFVRQRRPLQNGH